MKMPEGWESQSYEDDSGRTWQWVAFTDDTDAVRQLFAQAYDEDGAALIDECWEIDEPLPEISEDALAQAAMSFEAAYGEEDG